MGAVERNLVDSNLYIRMFRAQRNMYLCGFTLFLMLILSRFQAMILELAQMQESAANLEDKVHIAINDYLHITRYYNSYLERQSSSKSRLKK